MHSHSSSRFIALLLLCVTAAVVSALLLYIERQWDADSLPLGQRIPSFEAATMDGGFFARDSLGDKKVLLIFFAPGCSHCRNEISNLAQLYPKYKGMVDFVGISLDSAAAVKSLARELKLDFPIVVEKDEVLSEMFKIHILPSIFCIDEFQILRGRYTGEHSLSVDEHLINEFASSGNNK